MNNTNNFSHWLDTFVSEKGLDIDHLFIVETDANIHMIDLATVIETCKLAPTNEQEQIRTTIVKIDFHNGDVMHFFKYLADFIAKKSEA